MTRYWSKIAYSNLPTSIWRLRLGVNLLEFRRDILSQKTGVHALSYGVFMIVRLAVLAQYRRVTDRRTDGHTTTAHTALA